MVRLDENGDVLWQQSYGGIWEDRLTTFQQTTDGGFLLGGSSASPASGNKTAPRLGVTDFWLVRVDANGNKLWDKSFGRTNVYQIPELILARPDGGFLVAGIGYTYDLFFQTITFLGGTLWRVDSAGNTLWSQTLSPGKQVNFSTGIVPTSDGGLLVGGSMSYGGPNDIWLVKLSHEFCDSDDDGVEDEFDDCPDTPAGAIADAKGCSLDQLCPCEGPWRNHGEYVRCLRDQTERFLAAGLLTEAQRRELHNKAATSDLWKTKGQD